MERQESSSDLDTSGEYPSADEGYPSLGDGDVEDFDPKKADPEYFEFYCLDVEGVENLLNESVEKLRSSVQIAPSLAKVLLLTRNWAVNDIIAEYKENSSELLIKSKIKPRQTSEISASRRGKLVCSVCMDTPNVSEFSALSCGHEFCRACWNQHFEVQINEGISTSIGCMAKGCEILAPEDFVLNLLTKPSTMKLYQESSFQDYVKAHPELRFCTGPNCPVIIRGIEPVAKRVLCKMCNTGFCFLCGMDYHAPIACATLKKWLKKCSDDSETANYICANTKDCPKCHACIEKNGGCNHMHCYSCNHDFCWICFGDWSAHRTEHCSKYQEPDKVHEARESLKKYLHYYERWETHSKSLKFEQQTEEKIKARIESKVMSGDGTWIDWQHLTSAASLLVKCRYTLQYTYPYAYYMEPSAQKELFEYQQAQLEMEIENLSWEVEHSDTTDQKVIANQMDVAEKKRLTLLQTFLNV